MKKSLVEAPTSRLTLVAAVLISMAFVSGSSLATAEGEVAAAPSGKAAKEPPRFGTPEEKEEVRVRVDDYWKARIARERRVMDFYAPPEQGGPRGPGDVSEFGNLSYREVEIKDIKVGSNWASVTLRVRLNLMVGNVRLPEQAEYATFTEQWNLVDGTWYKKPTPPGLTPTKAKAQHDKEERKQDYLTKVKKLQEDYSADSAKEGGDAE